MPEGVPFGDSYLTKRRISLRSLGNGFMSRTSLHSYRITSSVKHLPERMIRIRFEVDHLDNHFIERIMAILANLDTEPLSRSVKGGARSVPEVIDILCVEAIEDRRHIQVFLIRDYGVDGFAARQTGIDHKANRQHNN